MTFKRKAHRKGKRDYNYQYKRRKQRIDSIKLSAGCCVCGYKEHSAALDFDHIDPSTKEFLIPRYLARTNLKRLFAEIRKCRIICANCHRVHSREQWNNGVTYRTKNMEANIRSV